VDDAYISALAYLTSVDHIGLSLTKLVKVSALANLKKLKKLNLSGTNADDIYVSTLGQLQTLEFLILSETNVVDITKLGNLMNLKYLDLSFTNVDNISAFAKLEKLEDILLFGTNVTPVDISALKTKLPELVVHRF
jgi:internalin A